jgi:hypothetical protein
MQRISEWTDLVTPAGEFRYGSLTGGEPPTPLKAEWFNLVQAELANFILASLPTLDAADSFQLLKAAQKMISNLAVQATTLAGYGITDAYTKAQADLIISGKASWAITLAGYGIDDAYTKAATTVLLNAKANNATSLAGYGIQDAYTKDGMDWLLSLKQNKNTASFGAASWVLDSATGALEQFGNFGMGGGASEQTILFPVAFPTACRVVMLTNRENAAAEGNVVRILDSDRYSVTIANSGGNTFTSYDWLAKGN